MSVLRAVVIAIAGLASACATIPASRSIALHAPGSFASEQTFARAESVPEAWPNSSWWRGFRDAQLDSLMTEALDESPTLRVAQARIREAIARAGITGANRYPQVEAALTTTRERFSANGLLPPPFAGNWSTLSELSATLTWDLDLWGTTRAAELARLDEARATAVDAYAARLALSGAIAHAYVQLERAYLQLDVATKTVQQREEIYSLTRDRNAAGIDSRLELKQAESALPAARTQIVQLEESIELTPRSAPRTATTCSGRAPTAVPTSLARNPPPPAR